MKADKRKIGRTIFRLSLIGLFIVAVLLASAIVLRALGLDHLTEEQIRDIVDDFGVWAPLVFIFITFLQVTFIPIPFTVSILARHVLFGFWGSFFYSLIGTMLGSYFAFLLGRKIGRPFVNWAFGDAALVDQYLKRAEGKEFVVFFFMFLLPVFPDDAICALVGITTLNIRQFTFMLLVGRPLAILGNLFLFSGDVIPFQGPGLIILIALVLLTFVLFIYSIKYADHLNELFNRMTDRIAKSVDSLRQSVTQKFRQKRHPETSPLTEEVADTPIEEPSSQENESATIP
jgi:uncharacterized membrane protein YdjX (TVP38/TMEM64 family)